MHFIWSVVCLGHTLERAACSTLFIQNTPPDKGSSRRMIYIEYKGQNEASWNGVNDGDYDVMSHVLII